MLDKKVACKKIGEICTNCGTLSMHDILFSISTRILMNASSFCTTVFNLYWTTIFKVFYFLFSSCIIPGDQLKFNCRKRYKKVNTLALRRLLLNSLFLLIESSVASGSAKVGKIYNQVCFRKNVFKVLKYVFKNFDPGKTFQFLKFSFTYSVRDLALYDYFSRSYGHFINHDSLWFFLPRICKNVKKVLI